MQTGQNSEKVKTKSPTIYTRREERVAFFWKGLKLKMMSVDITSIKKTIFKI